MTQTGFEGKGRRRVCREFFLVINLLQARSFKFHQTAAGALKDSD